MSIEVIPYKRIQSPSNTYEKIDSEFSIKDRIFNNKIIIYIVAILISFINFTPSYLPLGYSFFTASYTVKIKKSILFTMVTIGMVFSLFGEKILLYLLAMLFFYLNSKVFKINENASNTSISITSLLSYFIPSIIYLTFSNVRSYDFFILVFESLIIFSTNYIFMYFIKGINKKYKGYVFSNEEIISIAIVTILVLISFKDITLYSVSVGNTLLIIFILLTSYNFGAGSGAAIGVVVGMADSFFTINSGTQIIVYSLIGLLTGTLKKIGKRGVVIGVLIGSMTTLLYSTTSENIWLEYTEIIAAVGIFLIIPNKIIEKVSLNIIFEGVKTHERLTHGQKIRDLTTDRLIKFANGFKKISKVFLNEADLSGIKQKNHLETLFNMVVDKSCKECSLTSYCWERNFYNTYQSIFKVIERLNEKNTIDINDIPDYLKEKCHKINQLIDVANNTYDIFKLNLFWQRKISEGNEGVSKQMESVSDAISNVCNQLSEDVKFENAYEDNFLKLCMEEGVKIHDVVIYKNKYSRFEIIVYINDCKGTYKCENKIKKILSQVTNKKILKEANYCLKKFGDSSCAVKYIEEEKINITTGVATVSKDYNNVCGDNYTVINDGGGKYILTLCDGVGTGKTAEKQSKLTIELMEQLIDSGFDKKLAINIINYVLMLKTEEEDFSTIDLGTIDLYTGEIEAYKIGAVPTFIKSENGIKTLKSQTIPAGIVSEMNFKPIYHDAKVGDFVIMMSDGVYECFVMNEESIKIEEFIQNIQSKNPQYIADEIIKEASKICNNVPQDDMTVLVAKLWSRV